tara:strand:+ start:387 stop:521 length:135 start_codon:yes stop_codon:yes gene_type:complete
MNTLLKRNYNHNIRLSTCTHSADAPFTFAGSFIKKDPAKVVSHG